MYMKTKQWQTTCHLEICIFNFLLLEVINTNFKAPEKFLEGNLGRKKTFSPKQATTHYLTQFCQMFIISTEHWGHLRLLFPCSLKYRNLQINPMDSFFHVAFWHFPPVLGLFLLLPFYLKLIHVFKSQGLCILFI